MPNLSMSKVAGNIIQILADLPDFLRKPMLQNRLKEFYEMNDEEKQETIGMALAAVPAIDPHKFSVLFSTWLEVLSEFDGEKRSMMFQMYCKQLLANPCSIAKLNFKLLTAAFLLLDQRQQALLTDSMHEVLLGLPNRNEILNVIPDYSLKALGLK
jgi:hypothetical protein